MPVDTVTRQAHRRVLLLPRHLTHACDALTNRALAHTQDIDAGPVNAYTVALSPKDGRHVAAGSNTGEVNVFDVTTGEKVNI